MTEDHYCPTHQCKFYKNEKEGRTWYSHKLKDGTGYCNEPKTEAKPQSTAISSPQSNPIPQVAGIPTKSVSLVADEIRNRSMVISYSKDLAVAGKIEVKDITTHADKLLNWILGKEG